MLRKVLSSRIITKSAHRATLSKSNIQILPEFNFDYWPFKTQNPSKPASPTNIPNDKCPIKKMPVSFAMVREDSRQDLEIIRKYCPEDEKANMLMIASGGCTAALLAAEAPLSELTLIDPNLSQLELTKLKLHMLSLPKVKRLEILGHKEMDQSDRKTILQGLLKTLDIKENIFGNLDEASAVGLDHMGSYEKVFEDLRHRLQPYHRELEALFKFDNISQQKAFIEPSTEFGKALDEALDTSMSQHNLCYLFGEKATANRVQDFSRHFAERIRKYLSNHLAVNSPWLANMLLGRFLEDKPAPWFEAELEQKLPKIKYVNDFMNNFLETTVPESYHVIHLSNIIDWLTPEEANFILDAAYNALKPGGAVVIRQLNSNIDIVKAGNKFEWDLKTSDEFLHDDHSFFYRNFFIGTKPQASISPKIRVLADEVAAKFKVTEGTYFKDMPKMSKETFQDFQTQFFFLVDYFSRPMASLMSRLETHEERIDILHNLVEEHGHFSPSHYHSNTFKQFLTSIDVDVKKLKQVKETPMVTMWNTVLSGVCSNGDPTVALCCIGMIEFLFASISGMTAETVVQRGWVSKEDLVHYKLHAKIDTRHAEEFFKVVEKFADDPVERKKIVKGLELGAYMWNRFCEDQYKESSEL